jgi:hypothetical protein
MGMGIRGDLFSSVYLRHAGDEMIIELIRAVERHHGIRSEE